MGQQLATGPHAGHPGNCRDWARCLLKMSSHAHMERARRLSLSPTMDRSPLQTPPPATPAKYHLRQGTKQDNGNEIERAGLTNGKFYGVRVVRSGTVTAHRRRATILVWALRPPGFVGHARFELVEIGPAGDVSGMTGAFRSSRKRFRKTCSVCSAPRIVHREIQGAEDLSRHKDQNAANMSVAVNSRLWRLRVNNIDEPLEGGTIDILLSGKELPGPGWRMFDNITIDRHGRLLLQEDTGNNPWGRENLAVWSRNRKPDKIW